MNKVFNIENRFMNFLNFFGKLTVLNILWLICCLPVITIGASTSAMYSVMYKVVKDTDLFLIKDFFVSFKKNFIQSTVLWIILFAMGIIFSFDLRYALSGEGTIRNFFIFVGVIGLAITLVLFMYTFALQARFDNKIITYIKNSFLILVFCPIKSIMLVVVWIGPFILTYNSYLVLRYTGFIWFVFGFALQFYFACRILLSAFKKVSAEENQQSYQDKLPENYEEEED